MGDDINGFETNLFSAVEKAHKGRRDIVLLSLKSGIWDLSAPIRRNLSNKQRDDDGRDILLF